MNTHPNAHLWPRVSDAQRAELERQAAELERRAGELAGRITLYAGGGGIAYRLRLAEQTAGEARTFVGTIAAKPIREAK